VVVGAVLNGSSGVEALECLGGDSNYVRRANDRLAAAVEQFGGNGGAEGSSVRHGLLAVSNSPVDAYQQRIAAKRRQRAVWAANYQARAEVDGFVGSEDGLALGTLPAPPNLV
jgi:hypothetical protein